MKKRALLKFKNYEVHSITTIAADGRKNANIATWVMQSAMGAKRLIVALYKADYTIEIVRESNMLNVNLLAQIQTHLIQKLGRKSGRTTDKFKNLSYALDDRGCPYLTDAIGYVQCKVLSFTDSLDHEVLVCEVLKQVLLNPAEEVLTNNYLRANGLVRG